jgi:hypothetical protein
MDYFSGINFAIGSLFVLIIAGLTTFRYLEHKPVFPSALWPLAFAIFFFEVAAFHADHVCP